MDQLIIPKILQGKVTVPPSKSQAHRVIIAACLAAGTSTIQNVNLSQDIAATLSAMKALGAKAQKEGEQVICTGCRPNPKEGTVIDCTESGSTLRFLIPIALTAGKTVSFTGRGRLLSRPLEPYFDLCKKAGITYQKSDNAITFSGKLTGGDYTMTGNVSSQFITGLLYALPLAEKDSTLTITTPVESLGYIQMTLSVLSAFGITIKHKDYKTYIIPGGQTYRPLHTTVEGDYSQAAFYLCANAMGSRVDVLGLSDHTDQGDKEILSIINRFGNPLSAITIDVSQIPDLVPILAVLATQAEGTTHIVNAGRLRIKESDRLQSTTAMLKALGAHITEEAEGLVIQGKTPLTGGTVDACGDHRIAMAAAIAATVATGPVKIVGAECTAKSYENFWQDYAKLTK